MRLMHWGPKAFIQFVGALIETKQNDNVPLVEHCKDLQN